MPDVERRTYTEAEKAAVVEGYRSWQGTQRAYAESVGIAQANLSRWVSDDRRPHRRVLPIEAPTMLEVVRAQAVAAVEASQVTTGVRVALGSGVELRLDALPPARWVAELAAELRRC